MTKSRGFNRRTKGSVIFDYINGLFMILLSFSTLYPFLFLIFQSLGNSTRLSLVPSVCDFSAYQNVMTNSFIWSGFEWTILRTVIGTALSVLVTTSAAYALSKRWFPNRNFWTGMIVFTMQPGICGQRPECCSRSAESDCSQ